MNAPSRTLRIAILMTCFNRRTLTIQSLERLFAQENLQGSELTVFLVDDGSSDGTAAVVQEQFPAVHLMHGDGSLYWNGGMRKAFEKAMQCGFDFYIWFNDDSMLYPNAFSRLLECERLSAVTAGAAIIVGSFRDPITGVHTYGGIKRHAHGLRLDFVPVYPANDEALACDTMNGNLTLIPSSVTRKLGNLDGAFRHQLGDVDYGLRASSIGVPILVAPGYFGTCPDNSRSGTWRDRSQPLSRRWRHLMSPKGAPLMEWPLYTWRHFGWRWPLYAISPYLKAIFRPGAH